MHSSIGQYPCFWPVITRTLPMTVISYSSRIDGECAVVDEGAQLTTSGASRSSFKTSSLNSIQLLRDIGDVETEYQLVSPVAHPI
jgi:hypothetical protein